jgi:glycosyltransferase involved in cell wall biosynthesis
MSKPIRILHLVLSFDTERGGGGLTRFTTTLAKHLDPDHFEVSLCALANYGSIQEANRISALNDLGIKAFTTTPWIENEPYHSFINSTRNLRLFFKDYPVDIIHSHSEFSDISAILLKRKAKASALVRTIQYGYHQEWRTKPLRRYLFTNFLFPLFFDSEVGVNQSIVDRLDNRLVARMVKKKAALIYNAVDTSKIIPRVNNPDLLKRSLGIPEDGFVVCTIGRLAEQKGHRTLIEAIPEVVSLSPNVYFLIVGDGDLENALKEQAKSTPACENIIFTGPRSDTEELLQISDLYVSSSLWEGLPLALLETMRSKVPIIATDIPGTNELLQNHLTGLLVPPANSRALANGIIHLRNDPNLRARLVEAATQRLNNFSVNQISAEYEALYTRLT